MSGQLEENEHLEHKSDESVQSLRGGDEWAEGRMRKARQRRGKPPESLIPIFRKALRN